MVREFLDMIYPRECAVCGDYLSINEVHICEVCRKNMPLTYFWTWRDNPAEQMLWGRTYLQGVISLYFYSKDNDFCELVHKIKYEGNILLGKYLGQMLGQYISDTSYPLPDHIIPVPVHWRRHWQRGYNQAESIAEGLCKGLPKDIPVITGLLYRKKYTSSQTNMSMGVKWENAHDTFALRKNFPVNSLAGKHIYLVDDVLTSGATAEACFDALRSIPDLRITLVTLAYVKR